MSEENGIATVATEAGQADEGQHQETEQQLEGAEQEQQAAQEDGAEGEKKPEKTPEQREIERLRRGLERQRQRAAQWRAKAEITAQQGLTNRLSDLDYQSPSGDSEPLSLTKAQFAEAVLRKAQELAPTLQQQNAELAKRQGVIQSLEKKLGSERFNEVSESLDESFGGLTDASGKAKPAVDALFESDDPVSLVEYLADPENADEAERIAGMSAAKAGMALARIESKLAEAKSKPKISKAPVPLENIKGAGSVNAGSPDPIKNPKEWREWANQQERRSK